MRLGTFVRDSDVIAVLAASVATAEKQFELAFERDWRNVFHFALASTNDAAAAEDLAQDAFAKLWQHRHAFDWERPVLPWLLVTTRRLSTDRFRRLRRWLPMGRPVVALDDGVRERWMDIKIAMADLSPNERVAIVMSGVEGYGTEEIGKALEITPGAVRATISRARRKLEAAS